MFQTRRRFVELTFLTVGCASRLLAQTAQLMGGTMTGIWKQSNERSQPPRKGDVTLKIEQHNPELIVETTMVRASAAPRTAKQRYTTDGKPTTTTGADGDEFVTTATWRGSDLVMTVEEHEDGRKIQSEETWTLIDNGAALQRVRVFQSGQPKQTVIYLRQGGSS